jgi:hypothetical protein
MASWQAHKPADVGSSPAAPFMANGGVAQKEERGASNSVVAGSSPASPNADAACGKRDCGTRTRRRPIRRCLASPEADKRLEGDGLGLGSTPGIRWRSRPDEGYPVRLRASA